MSTYLNKSIKIDKNSDETNIQDSRFANHSEKEHQDGLAINLIIK